MLVLTRRVSERFMIGDEIVVTVVKIDGRQVRIGIEAPRDVLIRRTELKQFDPENQPKTEAEPPRVRNTQRVESRRASIDPFRDRT